MAIAVSTVPLLRTVRRSYTTEESHALPYAGGTGLNCTLTVSVQLGKHIPVRTMQLCLAYGFSL